MAAISVRHLARAACAAAAVAVLAAGTAAAASTAPSPATGTAAAVRMAPAAPVDDGENVFIPDEQNLDDCIGLLPRPGCGSEARGGWRQYLTMGVLALGLAFIGWRISKGGRARDRVVNDTAATGGSGRPSS
ncbi:MAG: hypothetical protein ACKOYG_06520 [Ilumatobacteraceae bacterium]